MAEEDDKPKRQRVAKKITKQRLKNIALYYLQRFETSSENLKSVLMRRVNDYAYQNPEWNKQEAVDWIEEIVTQFEGYGYVNDARFAEMKIKDYLAAGKSVRYIKGKLQLKGVDETTIDIVPWNWAAAKPAAVRCRCSWPGSGASIGSHVSEAAECFVYEQSYA